MDGWSKEKIIPMNKIDELKKRDEAIKILKQAAKFTEAEEMNPQGILRVNRLIEEAISLLE